MSPKKRPLLHVIQIVKRMTVLNILRPMTKVSGMMISIAFVGDRS